MDAPAAAATTAAPKLTQDETLIVTALEVGELTLDELSTSTRLPSYKVSSTLLLLEMKRLVKPLPGLRYVSMRQS